jgi:hypothetical protein
MAACSAAAVTKDQVAAICKDKSSGSMNCTCFSDELVKNLTPEQFTKVAQGIEDNRRFTGFIPANLADDATIAATIATAEQSCPAA